jgi:Family of unknown function (DUF6519)
MGNFSRDTFDKLKHYVGVRLQQGVPIVDADWNEQEDIRRFELRSFLKWFVGNGVPYGNNGFSIQPTGSDNDFGIAGGDGTAEGAGRCLVEGWDVLIESRMNYTAQALYNNAALATQWGVAPLPELTVPSADRTDTVYLDVWEREVNAAEDSSLVNVAIGLETCVRRKREWVVRVAEGSEPPAAVPGHVQYPVATLNRSGGQASLTFESIVDLRRVLLMVPPYGDIIQIRRDAFGDDDYELNHRGLRGLKVSLREAINAMLRGGLPSTPEQPFTTDAGYHFNASGLKDQRGDLWVFWSANTADGTNYDLWCRSYSASTETWGADTQLTSGPDSDFIAVPVEDKLGDIWVFWWRPTNSSQQSNIWSARFSRTTNTWSAPEQRTTGTNMDYDPTAIQSQTGDIWLFWQNSDAGSPDILFRRYDGATSTWDAAAPVTTDPHTDSSPVALSDSIGDVWIFWQSDRAGNPDIWYRRYGQASKTWGAETALTADSHQDFGPAVIQDTVGDVWVFWSSDRSGSSDIWLRRYSRAADAWGPETQVGFGTGNAQDPVAHVDVRGDIWVFASTGTNILYKRYSAAAGWSTLGQLTTAGDSNFNPVLLADGNGDLWTFWVQGLNNPSSYEIRYKKLIPAI